MAKGLTIFKAFSGVGSVAAAGAGVVVAVKSGIFLKKETSPTTTPQLSSLMSNSLDGDKLAQPSESLETGLFGDGGAGSFLDDLRNPDLLTSLGEAGVLGQPGAGLGDLNLYDSHTGGGLFSLPPPVSSSGPDSDSDSLDSDSLDSDDDGATIPDSPVSSSNSDNSLSSNPPPTEPNSQDSVSDTIVPTPSPAAPVPNDPSKNSDGPGDAIESDLDGVNKTPTSPTTPDDEGESVNSGETASADGSTPAQTTHTDENKTAPDVSAAPVAPGGATGGADEHGDGSQSSSLSDASQTSLEDDDEGGKTSASIPTPNDEAGDASLSTGGGDVDGESDAAPHDSTASGPVVNPPDSSETHTPQLTAESGVGGGATTGGGGVGGVGTGRAAEGEAGSGDTNGTANVGGGGTGGGGLSDSATEIGGDDQQQKDGSSPTNSQAEDAVIAQFTNLFNESESGDDWQGILDLIDSVVSKPITTIS